MVFNQDLGKSKILVVQISKKRVIDNEKINILLSKPWHELLQKNACIVSALPNNRVNADFQFAFNMPISNMHFIPHGNMILEK